jgi:acyl-coenzyme A synthetase/AMP-(fatty) acid ligase
MAHICQCLSRLLTFRRDFPVTVAGNHRKTGEQFVEEVVSLAHGLVQLGVTPGDVVAISAYNRYVIYYIQVRPLLALTNIRRKIYTAHLDEFPPIV